MDTNIDGIKGRPTTQAAETASSKVAVVATVEGHQHHLELHATPQLTAAQFAAEAAEKAGISGIMEVFVEDTDDPLVGNQPLLQQLPKEFVVLHVGTRAAIRVTFHFNGRAVHHEFRPSATIRTLTVWAVGSSGFNLEGSDSDYQLKHDGIVLEPDLHLGQITKGHKTIELDLVLKVKAQG